MNTITLADGASFHTHRGYLNHDELIGKPDGSVVRNTAGIEYQALRPLLADFVLSMPRGAAVVYPKDAGQIVTMADIFPGRARGRGRRRLRRAVHLAAARGGRRRLPALLRAPRGLRRRSPAATSRPSSAARTRPGRSRSATSADVLPTVAEPGSRRPRGPGHARALGVPRRRRHGPRARRRLDQLRRDDDPAFADGRGHPRRRPLHRARGVGVHGPRLAPRGPRRAPAPPDGRPHRLPAGHPPARRRRRRPAASSPARQGRVPRWRPTALPRWTTPSSGRPRPWGSGSSRTRSCAGRAATSARPPAPVATPADSGGLSPAGH